MASSSAESEIGVLSRSEIHELVEAMDVAPTRFLDATVTNTYLSFPDVCHFRAGSDWFSLLRLHHPTYPRLSKEFLTTLQLHHEEEDIMDNFSIEFKMGGVKYKLSLSNLNEAYDIKCWQNRTQYGEFNSEEFWKEITTQPTYELMKSKAIHILNPTLRYFHYVISNTVMGRSKGVENVCPWDLFALWGLTTGNQLNLVYFMLKHIQDVVIPYDKKFVTGGLLVPIALYCGVDLSQYKTVQGERKVDISYLFGLGILSLRAEGGLYIHFNDREPLVLPNLERIRLNEGKNWKLED